MSQDRPDPDRHTKETTMRKIVAGLFISLDGVIEAPEQWHFPYFNDEMSEAVASQMAAADTMLLGRRTYEEFAGYWANQGSEVELADQINGAQKLVASTTLQSVEWQNSTLIRGDVAQELRRIKQEPGRDISITGSATLVRSLLRDGLIDELRLLVHPIVVGSGKRLFEDGGERVPLKLVESKTFSTGVLYLTYAPADA
jgi:dihydrofolate reductase